MKKKEPKLHTIIADMSSHSYHQEMAGYSSSQFKDALEDEELFIAKYIKKTVERQETDAFDVGTYFHTGVLEPHKAKLECAVYPGKMRRGKDYEKFKKKNAGKAIVTKAQQEQALGLVRAVKDSPIAQEYLDGEAEVSLFVELYVYDGVIYAPQFKVYMTPSGWVGFDYAYIKDLKKKGFRVVVKVRADMKGDTYISDLKSTSGNARSNKSMRGKISDYHYDLSAALYMDLFSLMNRKITKFVWIFASKDFYNSRCYVASETNIRVGRAKWMKALKRIANCAANNWETVDFLDVLEPLPHELEHLKEKDTDLL